MKGVNFLKGYNKVNMHKFHAFTLDMTRDNR